MPRIDGTSRGGVGFAVGKSMDGREARGLTIWHLAFQNTMYCAQLFSADRSLIVFACGDANKKNIILEKNIRINYHAGTYSAFSDISFSP